jgi:hypothetical protein
MSRSLSSWRIALGAQDQARSARAPLFQAVPPVGIRRARGRASTGKDRVPQVSKTLITQITGPGYSLDVRDLCDE